MSRDMNSNENSRRPDYAARPEAFRHPPEHHPVTLSAEDAAAVDGLLENGNAGKVTGGDERTQRAAAWLETLGAHRVSQPPIDLLQRTLEVVQDERMKFEPVAAKVEAKSRGGIFSRRLAEYAAMAIAASVLLMVLIPGIGQARQTAKRAECASNQQALGKGFAGYASAHGNALPSLASPVGASWAPVAPTVATADHHSNTANVLPLVRQGYVTEIVRLTCPGAGVKQVENWSAERNDLPESLRGYNYVNMYGAQKPSWDKNANTIVLADANPIFQAGCTSIKDNSPNHGRNGTMVLYADGSSRWQQSPNIGPNQDNIWTVEGKQDLLYTYKEAPASLLDVFLSP